MQTKDDQDHTGYTHYPYIKGGPHCCPLPDKVGGADLKLTGAFMVSKPFVLLAQGIQTTDLLLRRPMARSNASSSPHQIVAQEQHMMHSGDHKDNF